MRHWLMGLEKRAEVVAKVEASLDRFWWMVGLEVSWGGRSIPDITRVERASLVVQFLEEPCKALNVVCVCPG